VGDVWFGIVDKFRVMIATEIRAAREQRGAGPGTDPDVVASTLVWAAERVLYVSSRRIDSRLDTPEDVVEGLMSIGMPAVYGVPYPPPTS
jgi:hypothetical protein